VVDGPSVRVSVRVCFTMLPSPVTCGVVFTAGIKWAASQQHVGIAAIVVSVVTRSDIVTLKWAASQQHVGIAAIVVSVVTRSDIVTLKWAASQQHVGIAAIVVSVVTRSDISNMWALRPLL
jgi:hypothetical protein